MQTKSNLFQNILEIEKSNAIKELIEIKEK